MSKDISHAYSSLHFSVCPREAPEIKNVELEFHENTTVLSTKGQTTSGVFRLNAKQPLEVATCGNAKVQVE